MASYASTAQVKAYLPDLGTDHDAVLGDIAERASRIIDRFTGRRFDTVVEARLFEGTGTNRIFVSDLVSVSLVRVKQDGTVGTTWTTVPSTNYFLGPPRRGEWPAQLVDVGITSTVSGFPLGYRTVEITGTWGWAAVPKDIEEATIELAVQMWRSRGSGADQYGIDAIQQQAIPRALPSLAHRITQYTARPVTFA